MKTIMRVAIVLAAGLTIFWFGCNSVAVEKTSEIKLGKQFSFKAPTFDGSFSLDSKTKFNEYTMTFGEMRTSKMHPQTPADPRVQKAYTAKEGATYLIITATIKNRGPEADLPIIRGLEVKTDSGEIFNVRMDWEKISSESAPRNRWESAPIEINLGGPAIDPGQQTKAIFWALIPDNTKPVEMTGRIYVSSKDPEDMNFRLKLTR